MNEAIRRAIEGGWRPKGLSLKDRPVSWIIQAVTNRSVFWERYILDPLFWQALGKAEGWHGVTIHRNTPTNPSPKYGDVALYANWANQMHRFIDHIIEGKPIDDFFNSLLK